MLVVQVFALNEGYWYSNETCKTSIGQDIYSCEEIYFKKNTNFPLLYFNVRLITGYDTRIEIPFTVISVGKSINNYFKAILKDWQLTCQNVDPSLLFDHNTIKLKLIIKIIELLFNGMQLTVSIISHFYLKY
jgi:hypothetical protein